MAKRGSSTRSSRAKTSARTRTRKPRIAAKWIKLWADPHLPGYDPVATAAPGEWFDAEAAQRAIDFFSECLHLIEGKGGGEPFILQPWQQAIVSCIFGWKRADGTRRYRNVLGYVPRKNGKTPLCAGIVNYVMFCDNEPGAQLYCAAAEKGQAALLFRHAAGMIRAEPELASRAKIYTSLQSIEVPATNTVFRALSAKPDSKHGLSAHLIIVDELHAHRDGELLDVLETSTAARSQPLLIAITTADFDRPSPCNQMHEYACKVRDGVLKDSSFLPVIYEALEDDQWDDPKVWQRVNPNYGVSLEPGYMEAECNKAKVEPSKQNRYRRLHLNQKTQQDVRWLSLDLWDLCAPADCDPIAWRQLALDMMKGRECFAGLDLSSTIDLTALVLWFPALEGSGERHILLPWFWVPAVGVERRAKKDRVDYPLWVKQGYIEATDGDVVDYDAIRGRVGELAEVYNIRELAIDRWNSTQLQTQLTSDGITVIQFGQGYASMSAPSKELERLVTCAGFDHGANPVMRWMASHVAIEQDAADNIKPSKAKSTERIDGIVSTVMAIGRANITPPEEKSVYESRGVTRV